MTNRKHKRLVRDYTRNQLQMYIKDSLFRVKAEIYQRQYDQKFVVSMSILDPSLSSRELEDMLLSNQSVSFVWVTHSVYDTFEEAMKQVVME